MADARSGPAKSQPPPSKSQPPSIKSQPPPVQSQPPAVKAAALETSFVCPQCRAPLAAGARGDLPALRCTGKHPEVAYPLMDAAVPVLLERPVQYLARTCIDTREMLRANQEWLDKLEDKVVEAQPDMAPRLSRLRDAERQNRAVLEQIFGLLRRGLAVDDVLDAAVLPPGTSAYSTNLNYILAYARRDFGGRAESEREIAVFEGALRRELEERGYERGNALVLGAGIGRIACGLREYFPRVVALDSSPVMAAVFRLLSRGPLRFSEINLNNARTADDQVVPVEAVLPPAPPGTQLDYAVADATALPLADNSQAAVVSVYFSDVVPLGKLGPEIARVLAPGGVFLHLGPVSYHFHDLDEQVSCEEFAARFARYGLEVGEPRLVANTLLATSALLDHSMFDILSFSAVKPA
jgi:carnosine N-methyltransferase